MASFMGGADSKPKMNLIELTNVRATGKVIGKGAFGRVIEVYVHETLCAAKEVHSILVDDVSPREFEGAKQSFLNECANASQINHPNVVQVLGICHLNPLQDRSLPCLVMEMMETSLTQFIEKYSNIPLHTKLSVLIDIAQGLEFLHCNQNIIHRDLSSNNVLLTRGLVAKLADFGVAKVMKQSKSGTQTRAPGTQFFMPPEALSVKPRYGKPVDVFSLACVILHVMSHRWPQPKDPMQWNPLTNSFICFTEVERREEYLCLCSPSSLESQVRQCLQIDPDQRPDISAVCKALKLIKAETNQASTLPAANNIDLLDMLQEKELQIQSLNEQLEENELKIQSLNKKLRDAESIHKQNDIEMESKDQELQNLKKRISDLQQQLANHPSNEMGLKDFEKTKMQLAKIGYHDKMPNNFSRKSKNGGSIHMDKKQRDLPMAGQLYGPKNEMEFYKNVGNQGHLLIQDIKEGLKYGYKLEEIRVATELQHGFKSPYEFLSKEWKNYIDRTALLVNQLSEEEHRKGNTTGSIGRPNRREIVKYLIEQGGNCERAAQKCCNDRLKMIQELMKEIRLPQADAVRALENNGLDVNRAIHAVYRDKINSNQLYQYMWGKLEGGGIKQMQNNRIEEMITQKLHNDYYLQRLLMAEYKLPTTANCDVLFQLVREFGLTLEACIEVAKVNDDIEEAKNLLLQECPLCFVEYSRNEMVNMIHCDHAVSHDCFVSHFSIMFKEKSIRYCNCPVCGEPDMTSEAIDVDLYLQVFSGLVQAYMEKEEYDMLTKKINEYTMMKDPNFRWCYKCSAGFINEAGRKKVQCPDPTCGEMMCFLCKIPWEDQHDTLNCEQFAEWKKDNDPDLQAQGLAAYLNEEGIECPYCGFKYALAKGGCMHFRCDKCPAEFCSGCNNLFRKAEDCTKYESCHEKGVHVHHTHNCLFFLRDESIEDLQKLLQDNNVEFDTEPSEGQVMAEQTRALHGADAPVAAPVAALKCHVMMRKECDYYRLPIDEECGIAAESGHAGLCLKHYKEYLVFKINQSHIDPLPLFTVGQLRAILMRDEVKVPNQQRGEGEQMYAERLRQVSIQYNSHI